MIWSHGCVPFFSTTSKKIMGISFLLIEMISYLFLPFPKGFLYMGTAFWLIRSTLISIVHEGKRPFASSAFLEHPFRVGILALGIGMNALKKIIPLPYLLERRNQLVPLTFGFKKFVLSSSELSCILWNFLLGNPHLLETSILSVESTFLINKNTQKLQCIKEE